MATGLALEIQVALGLLLVAAGFVLGVVVMSHAVTGFTLARRGISLPPLLIRSVAAVLLICGFALVMVTTGVLYVVVQQSIVR